MALFQTISDNLLKLIEESAPKLKNINPEKAADKSVNTWSIKEILGHLIDSATNNHHRFVKAQQVEQYQIEPYDQPFWVNSQRYNDAPWHELIDLWQLYNQHLARVISYIPDSKQTIPCHMNESDVISFGFLVEDYVHHMEHHLQQIKERMVPS